MDMPTDQCNKHSYSTETLFSSDSRLSSCQVDHSRYWVGKGKMKREQGILGGRKVMFLLKEVN